MYDQLLPPEASGNQTTDAREVFLTTVDNLEEYYPNLQWQLVKDKQKMVTCRRIPSLSRARLSGRQRR